MNAIKPPFAAIPSTAAFALWVCGWCAASDSLHPCLFQWCCAGCGFCTPKAPTVAPACLLRKLYLPWAHLSAKPRASSSNTCSNDTQAMKSRLHASIQENSAIVWKWLFPAPQLWPLRGHVANSLEHKVTTAGVKAIMLWTPLFQLTSEGHNGLHNSSLYRLYRLYRLWCDTEVSAPETDRVDASASGQPHVNQWCGSSCRVGAVSLRWRQ